MVSMPEQRPFFTRIESLRGLGACAVAGWHMSGFTLHGVQLFPHLTWAGIGSVQNTLGKIAFVLLPGHAALMMFFVISGCVLRVSLQYGPQAWAAGVWRFASARGFRLFSDCGRRDAAGRLGRGLADHRNGGTAGDAADDLNVGRQYAVARRI